ncbi:helix-turn-helix domain-containing protein [Mucilaginibacter sp. AW1-7]|jgi:transcriptional regulator with XRE-family HTH domain|uniref:helix-turn-helix domain-containing protein n=1 Tax=Mucilaginibacter sp. AW1-7 TaxID=3349874 RepID=UPI003F739146
MNDDEKDLFNSSLGEKIKSIRKGHNFGVRELALIAEIEHHQLINIEKGRVDIRLSTLRKIAKALKCTPKDLLDFEFEINSIKIK